MQTFLSSLLAAFALDLLVTRRQTIRLSPIINFLSNKKLIKAYYALRRAHNKSSLWHLQFTFSTFHECGTNFCATNTKDHITFSACCFHISVKKWKIHQIGHLYLNKDIERSSLYLSVDSHSCSVNTLKDFIITRVCAEKCKSKQFRNP